MNETKNRVGAPRKEVKFPRKSVFTIIDLIAINPAVNEATLRNRLQDGLAASTIVFAAPVKSGKRGKPLFQYSLA